MMSESEPSARSYPAPIVDEKAARKPEFMSYKAKGDIKVFFTSSLSSRHLVLRKDYKI